MKRKKKVSDAHQTTLTQLVAAMESGVPGVIDAASSTPPPRLECENEGESEHATSIVSPPKQRETTTAPAEVVHSDDFFRDQVFGDMNDADFLDLSQPSFITGSGPDSEEDRKLPPVDTDRFPIQHEASFLLPYEEDSRSSWVTVESASHVPAANVAHAQSSPAPSTGSESGVASRRTVRANPYLKDKSKLKRTIVAPPATSDAASGSVSDIKKQRTETTHETSESPSGRTTNHYTPASNGVNHMLNQAEGAVVPPVLEPPQASSSTNTHGSGPIILASSRTRCQVVGTAPQRNLEQSFERSGVPRSGSQDEWAVGEPCRSKKAKVGGKYYDISLEPRRIPFIEGEYRVGDVYVCVVAKTDKTATKWIRSLNGCNFTIRGFVTAGCKEYAVVEQRMELKDTFLKACFDPEADRSWMGRYGSKYITGEQENLVPLLRLKKARNGESLPTSCLHYSGISAGNNINLVYENRSAHSTTFVDRALRRKPVVLELFAGGGGMSRGLKDAGFDVKYMVESKEYFAETLRMNFEPGSRVYQEDVNEFLENVRNKVSDYPRIGDVDHIHASSPCQGFSSSNTNGGINDTPNNELSKAFFAAVKALRPRTASFENVQGMLREKTVSYLHEIMRELLLAGYHFRLCVLNSSKYSVPQTRRRLFILASQQGYPIPSKPLPTAPCTVSDAIRDLESVQPMPVTGLVRLPDGSRVLHHNIERTQVQSGAFHLSQYNDSVVPAVRRQKPLKHYSPKFNRMLTVRELARLQTFPDDHVFCGSVKDMRDQVGNAVPCKLAFAVGKSLMECHTKELAPSNPV